MPPPQPWGHHQGLPPNAGGPGYGGNPQFMPPRQRDNFYPPSDLGPLGKQPHQAILQEDMVQPMVLIMGIRQSEMKDHFD